MGIDLSSSPSPGSTELFGFAPGTRTDPTLKERTICDLRDEKMGDAVRVTDALIETGVRT